MWTTHGRSGQGQSWMIACSWREVVLSPAPTAATLCVGGHTQVVGELFPAVLHHLKQWNTPTCGELGTLEFFGHRLQTLMTRATVEDGTARMGQTLQTARLLVGGLSLNGISGLCINLWHMGCQSGIQAQSMSCSGGRLSTCDPHATPWAAPGPVNSEDPTESTAKRTKNAKREPPEKHWTHS